IALALVVFASWLPVRVLIGAYLFGTVTILGFVLQGLGIGIPSQLLSALPYVVTVLALVVISGNRMLMRANTPACLGQPFVPDRSIERLARENCKIIFATSFGFMDSVIKVAKKFPKVKFEHATGYKTAKNVSIYNARFYEGRYVMGEIAAKVSKAGLAGYIVS